MSHLLCVVRKLILLFGENLNYELLWFMFGRIVKIVTLQ